MPSHSETQLLPYSTKQIFDLVADVERYPEFLPWCVAARILERHEKEGYFIAELRLGYKQLREQYTSRVVLTPPSDKHTSAEINVTLIKGPFHHLDNRWQFIPEGEYTRVEFFLDFRFRSKTLEKIAGKLFLHITEKMVSAFKDRADALYSN